MHNKKTVQNAKWIIGCKLFQSLLQLLVGMLSARYLGPSNYGLISYAASVVAFVVPVMQLGMRSTLVQEYVVSPEKEGKILGTSLVLNLVSGVACIVAVNAVGDVVDENGTVIAGMRAPSGTFVNTEDFLLSGGKSQLLVGTNTTIGAVLTDVALDKAQANRLATVAHDGYARAIHPVHTQSDGDTIFALSCGDKQENFVILCTAAAKAMAQAIRNAVTRGERL